MDQKRYDVAPVSANPWRVITLLVLLVLAACQPGAVTTDRPEATPAIAGRLSATKTVPPALPPAKVTPSHRATATTGAPAGAAEAQVARVIDGDTIDVSIDGQTYRVRYIGIDTPESTIEHEPYGPEATAKNKELVEGKTVRLEKDVSETDRYGRLLRYVYAGDVMVNAELVRQGYAQASTYPPDVRYQAQFAELQREARAAGRGLWGLPAGQTPAPSVARPTAPSVAQPTAPLPANGEYSCDRCIKGNITGAGERIYHFPGCRDYDQTVITESKGEQWFSTEAEAKAAGWRRALSCP